MQIDMFYLLFINVYKFLGIEFYFYIEWAVLFFMTDLSEFIIEFEFLFYWDVLIALFPVFKLRSNFIKFQFTDPRAD